MAISLEQWMADVIKCEKTIIKYFEAKRNRTSDRFAQYQICIISTKEKIPVRILFQNEAENLFSYMISNNESSLG